MSARPDKPFHWHGTMAEIDAMILRRWVDASESRGLDSGFPGAQAAVAARKKRAEEIAAPLLELTSEDWRVVLDMRPDLRRRLRAVMRGGPM